MVHRTYYGLGPPDAAVRDFDALAPHVEEILALQGECEPFTPDHKAFDIALDGLETAAYHFTRRRHYYDALRAEARRRGRSGNNRLGDRQEAVAAFQALTPYVDRLRVLQRNCRPLGRDYLALDIARHGLETAAYHFTRISHFYGARGDSAGPVRPVI